ncbi:SGS-domain-containing protein [Trichodelitschia bisporula]|uniref:SGS-domain-containing protein n=1 Tax=Trichodelitschia bisporula TaxID=703511 RepID=A0A6G1I436_9PEZI|nr:SGS-domain-containing protein [Trichodelitschia bisporula]
MEAAKRGAAALEAGKYDDAITEYTAALRTLPTAVDYFLKRSTAYQRLSPPNYEAALNDAEIAVTLAYKRAKRELIHQTQLRRAIILYLTERYADARFVLELAKKFDPNGKSVPIWEIKIMTKFNSLPGGDERLVTRATENPGIEPSNQQQPSTTASDTSKSVSKPTPKVSEPGRTPASKIKKDWYQSRESVFVSLLAKGVPKDQAVVEIQELSVTVSFPTAAATTYEFSLDPLWAPIDAASSTFQVTPTKVELVLKKKVLGKQWKCLEGIEGEAPPSAATSEEAPETQARTPNIAKAPSYPTSSRHGPKDWDRVASDLTSKPKEAGNEASEYDDLDEGDPANAFFKHLYKSADPDTRRAMMKSYVESNGTVLSTNWDEVKRKKTETSPPDGLEAKKWDE